MDNAIASLEAEVNALQAQGNGSGPSAGSSEWWTMCAKSLGLSYLKVIKKKGITDPVVAESYRKSLRKEMQDAGA